VAAAVALAASETVQLPLAGVSGRLYVRKEIGKIISCHLFDRNDCRSARIGIRIHERGVPGDRTDGVFEILSRVPGGVARERIQSPLLSLAKDISSKESRRRQWL